MNKQTREHLCKANREIAWAIEQSEQGEFYRQCLRESLMSAQAALTDAMMASGLVDECERLVSRTAVTLIPPSDVRATEPAPPMPAEEVA